MTTSTWSKDRLVGQKKTGTPVQFEITGGTRAAVADWIRTAKILT